MTGSLSDASLFDGLTYPESPRWRNGLLWISDVHSFRLKAFDTNGECLANVSVPGRPAGTGFLPDGGLLIATAVGWTLQRLDGDMLTDVADLSGLTTGLLNDMVVDAAGRAYVGDTGYDLGAGEPHRPGRLLTVDAAGEARVVVDNITFPNGMAITPDGRTLYLAETFASRITAFDILPDGDLTNRRSHAELDGTPDGLCLDTDGGLWIALLAKGAFVRIDANGRETHRITAAPRYAIACMLGGPDRETLYLCHAVVGDVAERRGVVSAMAAPFAGAGQP